MASLSLEMQAIAVPAGSHISSLEVDEKEMESLLRSFSPELP
jgi:hypothetical protein